MVKKYFSVTYSVNGQSFNNTYATGVSIEIDPLETAVNRHFKLTDAIKKTHLSQFGQIISSYDVILKCVVDLT